MDESGVVFRFFRDDDFDDEDDLDDVVFKDDATFEEEEEEDAVVVVVDVVVAAVVAAVVVVDDDDDDDDDDDGGVGSPRSESMRARAALSFARVALWASTSATSSSCDARRSPVRSSSLVWSVTAWAEAPCSTSWRTVRTAACSTFRRRYAASMRRRWSMWVGGGVGEGEEGGDDERGSVNGGVTRS